MGKIIKVFNIFIAFALVTLALLVAFIALPIFGNQALIVRSGSMTPTIGVGSIIVVRPNDTLISPIDTKPRYERGDVIAFRSEKNSNTIITHRITSYEIFNNTVFYKTKGDANEEEDNWQVDEKQILGKNFVTIPHAGKILAFAKSKYGFPALIIFPSLVVIILEVINIIKELKKHKKTTTEEIIKPQSSPTFFINLKPLKVIVPLLAAGIIIPVALAFYGDTETSSGNVLQAAAVFPTFPISITPTITQTPTPTPIAFSCPTTTGAVVVINEINWAGANGDGNDEWIELCNTTELPIDLTNWIVERLGTGSGVGANIVIPSGIIPANGFFIISNNIQSSSKINVPSDLVDTSVSLENGGEQLILKNSTGSIIDIANGTAAWYAGSNSTPKKSMERISPVATGTASINWQTAITHTNMDSNGPADEFGTPKAANGL